MHGLGILVVTTLIGDNQPASHGFGNQYVVFTLAFKLCCDLFPGVICMSHMYLLLVSKF